MSWMNEGRRGVPSFDAEELGAVEPTAEMVERVWDRLAQSQSRKRMLFSRERGWLLASGLGVLSAFVLGVWVGRGSGRGASEPSRVSAEPVAVHLFGNTNVSNGAAAGSFVAGIASQEVNDERETEKREGGGVSEAAKQRSQDLRSAGAVRRASASLVRSSPTGSNARAKLPSGANGPVAFRAKVAPPRRGGLAKRTAVESLEKTAVLKRATRPLSTLTVTPRWRVLASTGDYEASLFELSRSGGFDAALGGENSEGLLLLADVARATGQPLRAIAALRRLLQNYSASAAAPLAAWSLGNLLEKAGDRAGAAQAFATYEALSPGGDFAEDAHVRRVRAAVDDLDKPRADALAADYRRLYPKGKYLSALSAWFAAAEWPKQKKGSAAPSGGAVSVEETAPAELNQSGTGRADAGADPAKETAPSESSAGDDGAVSNDGSARPPPPSAPPGEQASDDEAKVRETKDAPAKSSAPRKPAKTKQQKQPSGAD